MLKRFKMQLASFVIRFMTCQKFLFCRNDGNFISHFNLPRKFEMKPGDK